MPACTHCGGDSPHYAWQQRRDGGWHIRVECGECGGFLKFAAQVEPFVGFANVAFVWLAVHQVGFLYADGRLGRGLGLVLAGTGLAAA